MGREEQWKEEEVVRSILRKLEGSNVLTPYEFRCVSTALRESENIKQTPYYEVVYHDEYDRTESRIMNPVNVSVRDDGHIRVRQDRFELNFNRLLP